MRLWAARLALALAAHLAPPGDARACIRAHYGTACAESTHYEEVCSGYLNFAEDCGSVLPLLAEPVSCVPIPRAADNTKRHVSCVAGATWPGRCWQLLRAAGGLGWVGRGLQRARALRRVGLADGRLGDRLMPALGVGAVLLMVLWYRNLAGAADLLLVGSALLLCTGAGRTRPGMGGAGRLPSPEKARHRVGQPVVVLAAGLPGFARRGVVILGVAAVAAGLGWDRSCNTDPKSVDACAPWCGASNGPLRFAGCL